MEENTGSYACSYQGYQAVRENKEICAFLRKGNENLGVMGFTDHSQAHCGLVAERGAEILRKFEYPEHDIELVKIAGFMHDIGNAVNRTHHAEYGALLANELLKEIGCVGDAYVDAMLEREKLVTTYMGLGVAIPHGTTQAKGEVKKSGIVMLQYPEGVPFGDEKAQLVFGIAGVGDEHLDLLANISNALEDEDLLEKLKTTNDVDLILKTFS